LNTKVDCNGKDIDLQDKPNRREWLFQTASVLSGLYLAGDSSGRAAAAATAPARPVAIVGCKTYRTEELLPAMARMFDQLGGLGRMVKGKTVAIKINLTGAPNLRVGYSPLGDTHYTHPQVIAATVHLMGKAGARRIRVLESPWATAGPIEEYILQANWDPREILSAAADVEFENTNYLGRGKRYSRLPVPSGGYVFPAFDLNHSYEDCDVFVSLAKMKEHDTAGITLSMKNCFGITPATIYGSTAGIDEPSLLPKSGRDLFHSGFRQPSKSAPAEKDPSSPREGGYRVPRIIVDLVAARPIDLAIVEAVTTMTGGEGPWIPQPQTLVRPGVIVAGTNPVTTDAVCMAVMGFDPQADRGTPPFEGCDSTLRLAEDAGIGTRDLRRIELLGMPVKEAQFDFAAIRRKRRQAAS
jgi:uncharacterized protein (DUF362 family)